MPAKCSNKDPKSQQSEKPIKSRAAFARLAKDDIHCNMYAKQLKGGSKKVSVRYKIGTQKRNKTWKSENPYSYANSISEPTFPDWYNKNVKIEKKETSPDPIPQEIVIPDIVQPDPSRKSGRRNG